MSADKLYFDDMTVGRRFGSSSLRVERDAMLDFARAYDPQPFHLDEAAAKASLFGGLVASGWFTAALTMRLLVDALPMAAGIIGAGMDELRWPKPVRAGDVLRAQSEVVEARISRRRPDQGVIKMRTTTLNQNDDPVQIFLANLFVPRRPGAV